MPLPYPSIHPQLSEWHDPHFNLDSLIDQLCAYISNADTCARMSPVQKAGVLYLTLIEAYEWCGMMAERACS
jgi:methyl coenzyme M reductase gamma subunit